MAADPSIYSQLGRGVTPLQSPMDQFGQAMQVKNLMGQSQLQGLQIGQAERGIEEQQRLRALFGGGNTPTTQEVMAVSPTSGIQYGKSLAEQQAAKAKLLEQDDKLIKSFGEYAKEELITVTDQASWDKYRALQRQRASLLSTPQFQQVALEALQKDPEVFDPAIIKAKLFGGVPGKVMNLGGTSALVHPNTGELIGPQRQNTPTPGNQIAADQLAVSRAEAADRGVALPPSSALPGQTAPIDPAAPGPALVGAPVPAAAAPAPIGLSPRQQREIAAKHAEEMPKDVKSLRSLIPGLQRMKDEANAILADPNLGWAIGANYMMGDIPGTPGRGVASRIKTLTAQVFGNVITALREASKTGGLVGNMSDAEGARFEAMVASLDRAQGEEDFKARLQQIINYTNELENQALAGFKETYKQDPPKFERSRSVVSSPAAKPASGGGIKFLGFD
jgi:hypothetical protein